MSETVDIFTVSRGRKEFVGIAVPKDLLAAYSDLASAIYFPASGIKAKPHPKRLINWKNFDLGENMHEEFARVIVTLIRGYNKSNPAPMTLDLFGSDLTFGQMVALYKLIGQGFKVPREIHQDSVRNTLRTQIYKNDPFTFANFKLVAEELAFDRGIFYSNMDRACFLEQKQQLDEKVKREITQYCKEREGIWNSLLEVVGAVEHKVKSAAENKKARIEGQKSVLQRMKEKSGTGLEEDSGLNEGEGDEESAELTGSKTSASKGNGGKGKGKGKGKVKGKGKAAEKKVEPFVKRDEDFPALG